MRAIECDTSMPPLDLPEQLKKNIAIVIDARRFTDIERETEPDARILVTLNVWEKNKQRGTLEEGERDGSPLFFQL